MNDSFTYWREKGLSIRASNVLSAAGIMCILDLNSKIISLEYLYGIKNCGEKTAIEIWDYRSRLSVDMEKEYTNNSKLNSGHRVYLPFLGISISLKDYRILTKIKTKDIKCSLEFWNKDLVNRYSNLAELASAKPNEILKIHGIGSFRIGYIRNIILSRIDNRLIDYYEKCTVDSLNKHDVIDWKKIEKTKFDLLSDSPLNDDKIESYQHLARVLLNQLSEKERLIVNLKYGFVTNEMTLQSIGDLLSLTRERIRQILKRANNKAKRTFAKLISIKLLPVNESFIIDKIDEYNGKVIIEEIRTQILYMPQKPDLEVAFFTWLDDIVGNYWPLLGSNYIEISGNYCHIKK